MTRRQDGERVVVALFALAALWWLAMSRVGWEHTVSDGNGFRQSQTALTSYWMLHGGPLLAYETPVLGPPWSVPFELPVYQWCAAAASRALGIPLVQAGRLVSEVFFALTLAALYGILAEVEVRPRHRLAVLALVLASPLYLFWSRTFMIESTALFFGAAHLLGLLRWSRTRHPRDAALAAATGCVGIAVKVTTFAGIWLVAVAVAAWRLRRAATTRAAALAAAALAPLVALALWNRFTDGIKVRHAIGVGMTSDSPEMRAWILAPLSERFAWSNHRLLFQRTFPDLFGTPWLLAAALAVLAFARRRLGPAAVCLAGFLAGYLLFVNLHVVHDYYAYANGVFLLAAIGFAVVGALERGGSRRAAGIALLALALLSSAHAYRQRQYPRQSRNNTGIAQLAGVVRRLTGPNDVVVGMGFDWSSEIPFYAERRGFMWPKWLPTSFDDPKVAAQMKNLSAVSIGALAACGAALQQPAFVAEAAARFGLPREPAVEGSGCVVFAHPRGSRASAADPP